MNENQEFVDSSNKFFRFKDFGSSESQKSGGIKKCVKKFNEWKHVVQHINTKEKAYNILEELKGGAVEIKNRSLLLTKYPSSFIGSNAVDWFVKKFHFSRKQAVKLGELLIEVKGIQGLNNRHFIDDTQSLYRVIAHNKNELSLLESRYKKITNQTTYTKDHLVRCHYGSA